MNRFVLLLTMLSLLVPLAGCGGDDVNPDALAQAADRTAAVDGMSIDGTAVVHVPGAGPMRMTLAGVADVKGRRVRIKSTSASQAALNMETVMIGTTMYLKSATFQQAFDKAWARIDMQKALEGSGVDFAALQQMGSGDPAQQLRMLKQTSDLEELGDGHFKGTSDLRKYPGGEKLAKLSGDPLVPVEVWVGESGYVERYKMRMTQKAGGRTVQSDMDVRYSDFGRRVEVQAPPAGDVKDMTDLAKKGIAEQQGN